MTTTDGRTDADGHTAERSAARGPLAGVRVIETAEYVSGPMAGVVLADLGADVVKVERPGRGDAFRTFGLKRNGVSAFWLNVNRGKRSVQIDLKDGEGRRLFLELVGTADVLIQNTRPGVADELGLGDEVLVAANPRLVRVVITGFGPSGPNADEPVYDNVVQAVSGLASAQGTPGLPQTVATAVIDKVTAFTAAQAALAALVERQVTGRGRRIDLAMLDVAAYWNFADLFQDRTFLADDRRIAPSRSCVVGTTDGHIVVVPASGRQIGRAADAMGHPEWKDLLRAITDPAALMDALIERVEGETSRMTTEEALRRLRIHDVPAAAVHDLDQHLRHPQVIHNEVYSEVDDPTVGPVRVVRYPARFDGRSQTARFTCPKVGEHQEEVAAQWLGP